MVGTLAVLSVGCGQCPVPFFNGDLFGFQRDAGRDDSGVGDGGWSVRRVTLPIEGGPFDGSYGIQWFPSALSPTGMFAGKVSAPGKQNVWIADPSGTIVYDDDALAQIFSVNGIDGTGRLCGSRYDTQLGAIAVAGTFDAGFVDLFDGGSECVGISSKGDAIVVVGTRTAIKPIDGGTVFIAAFDYADGGVNPTRGFAVSDSTAVVGYVLNGAPFGRGNPVGFYWTPDGGILLDNGPRESEAYGLGPGGEIVGSGVDLRGTKVAMRWATPVSAPETLALPSGFVTATALSVNGAGLIVGWGLDAASQSHGLMWWHGQVFLADDVLGPPTVHIFWLGLANSAGRIVGFTTEPGTLADGGTYSNSRAIAVDFLSYPP